MTSDPIGRLVALLERPDLSDDDHALVERHLNAAQETREVARGIILVPSGSEAS